MGAVLEVELVGETSFGVQKGAGGFLAHQLEHQGADFRIVKAFD
jgi:hypothetical protein